MKRFVFRLDGVLRLRQFELDRSRRQLAEVQRERTRRQGLLDESRTALSHGQALLEADARSGVDGDRLALRAQGVILGRMAVGRAERAVSDLVPVLNEARARLMAAHARVKSLEKLRDRQAEAHRVESLSREQAALEDLSVQRLARTRDAAQRAASHPIVRDREANA